MTLCRSTTPASEWPCCLDLPLFRRRDQCVKNFRRWPSRFRVYVQQMPLSALQGYEGGMERRQTLRVIGLLEMGDQFFAETLSMGDLQKPNREAEIFEQGFDRFGRAIEMRDRRSKIPPG